MSDKRFWAGDWTEPRIEFRIEVDARGVELIWFDPNPHSGHDVGEHRSLEEFLASETDHQSVRTACGPEALEEVIAFVRLLLAARHG
jgi:hypothetical protein